MALMTCMQAFDFDTPIERRETSSLKWERYAGRDILPLWVADMDFRSPPSVIEALHRRVDHGVFGYTLPSAALTETIREMLKDKYGWEVEAEWIICLPGLVSGINVSCRSVGMDGDEVMTTIPAYPPFLSAPRLSRRRLLSVPMSCRNGLWAIDMEGLEAAVTDRTRLFILCSPHNPTGRLFSLNELRKLAEFARDHDLVMCSDEIHCDLVLDETRKHIPFACAHPGNAGRTITLMSPSKTYNIPGLGFSFAVIPNPELRRRFSDAMDGIVPDINAFGYEAALAAYRGGAGWLEELLDYLRINKDTLMSRVGGWEGLSVAYPEATYLAWIDVRPLGLDDTSRWFENAGVGLSDGREFGIPGFVRLNFGCSRSTLIEALRRMEQALNSRKALSSSRAR